MNRSEPQPQSSITINHCQPCWGAILNHGSPLSTTNYDCWPWSPIVVIIVIFVATNMMRRINEPFCQPAALPISSFVIFRVAHSVSSPWSSTGDWAPGCPETWGQIFSISFPFSQIDCWPPRGCFNIPNPSRPMRWTNLGVCLYACVMSFSRVQAPFGVETKKRVTCLSKSKFFPNLLVVGKKTFSLACVSSDVPTNTKLSGCFCSSQGGFPITQTSKLSF